jgi:hypothetical protein
VRETEEGNCAAGLLLPLDGLVLSVAQTPISPRLSLTISRHGWERLKFRTARDSMDRLFAGRAIDRRVDVHPGEIRMRSATVTPAFGEGRVGDGATSSAESIGLAAASFFRARGFIDNLGSAPYPAGE